MARWVGITIIAIIAIITIITIITIIAIITIITSKQIMMMMMMLQVGWVLQCLDNVGQDSQCSNPPCAIVPLGTGFPNHQSSENMEVIMAMIMILNMDIFPILILMLIPY